ncbi:MAG: iron ABC transporter permease [Phycisphaerales bacterium]|nr:iron ABC transporter permease [Phycisphaerales bacterium]
MSRLASQYSLIGVLLVVLGVTLLYPIFLTVRGAFIAHTESGDRLTLVNFLLLFEDPAIVRGFVNTLLVAAASTGLSIVLALPLAVVAAKYTYPLKPVFNAIILVPLILPPFVGAIGMAALMGREGGINALLGTEFDFLGRAKFWGVALVNALHLYPVIYLNATAALANLDPALEEAADNLGAGPWRRFFKITLPLIRPGLFAGATIVFIFALTEIGTPLAFDYNQVTPVQIFVKLKAVEASAEPYALTVAMLALALAIYALGKFVFGRAGYAMYSKASRAAGERALAGPGAWIATGAFTVVTLLAMLPHIGVVLTALAAPASWYKSVVPRSFTLNNFQEALTHPEAFNSIVVSLKLASASVVLNMTIGLLVAYVIVRTRVRGRGVLDALCMLPLAVPGLVMAFGYVAMTLQWPFKGDLNILGIGIPAVFTGVTIFGSDPNPFPLLIVVYAVRRLPYVVRSAVSGLEQTSGELEEAAMNLGASRITAVRKVILPLIAANLIAGGLLAFSFAMLAVSEPLVMAQSPRDFPITSAIYGFLTRMGDGPHIASAMGVWGMALLAVTLVGASVLLGKKLGSIFRV